VVAIVVATTGLSTELATAFVVVVGALPGIVTAIVSATRSTAAGGLLVQLTPAVADLARSTLEAAKTTNDLTKKTTTLKDVTESMASWSSVLSAEPGTKPAAKETGGA
jgi:redox-regulated HSP33 family molecular chaperone